MRREMRVNTTSESKDNTQTKRDKEGRRSKMRVLRRARERGERKRERKRERESAKERAN